MARTLTVAAAQLGPIQMAEPRSVAIERMLRLLERAKARGAELVVFPELALTTFFPRHHYATLEEADQWFETAMPSNETAPLFAAARAWGIGFHLGYAEIAEEPDETGRLRKRRFNTAILVGPEGDILLKYRKIHLPGHAEYDPARKVQHLEKRYFEVGNLGFPVIRAPMGGLPAVNMGMMICNDRRWPESWRVLGLQKAPSSFCSATTRRASIRRGRDSRRIISGFSTAISRSRPARIRIPASRWRRRRRASRTAASFSAIRSSSIREGEIIAMATSWDDELITADCDLDRCALGRTTVFAFEKHRRPEHYGRITSQVGAVDPPVWERKAAE